MIYPNKQSDILGFTLIEVLMAVALLSFVMIGMEMIALSSLNSTRQAFYQTIAAHQLENFADLMERFPNNYSTFYSEWNQENSELLPNGAGSVSGTQDRIIVQWHAEKEAKDSHEITLRVAT